MSDIVERLRRLVGQESIGPVALALLARDAADKIERLRDWQRRAVDWMYASVLAPGQNIRQDERQALIEEAQP